MRPRSIYVAYANTVTAEACCSAGHATQQEAMQHANDVRTEREAAHRAAMRPRPGSVRQEPSS